MKETKDIQTAPAANDSGQSNDDTRPEWPEWEEFASWLTAGEHGEIRDERIRGYAIWLLGYHAAERDPANKERELKAANDYRRFVTGRGW